MKYPVLTLLLAAVITIALSSCGQRDPYIMDLSGSWTVALDSTGSGLAEQWQNKTFTQSIRIPGTTDEAELGIETEEAAYGNLSRTYKYIGPAWYQRKIRIPESWRDNPVTLHLERVLWESSVWIDDRPAGSLDALGTPHIHDLGLLEPGEHTLTIRVNNEMIHNIGDKGHAYSESMQSIWNGMVGRIELQANPQPGITHSRIFCEPGSDQLHVDLNFSLPPDQSMQVRVSVFENPRHKKVFSQDLQIDPGKGETTASITLDLSEPLKNWSEFDPALYTLEIEREIKGRSVCIHSSPFGVRSVDHDGTKIRINGSPVFLRGNLDCIHFPLTGYPSCDVKEWERIFRIYREYGLNHVRFHSWCPPEAAFEAADKLGIYIQAEASIWVDGWMSVDNATRGRMTHETLGHPVGLGFDAPRDSFVREEIRRVIRQYGNHPSFIMFCIGNELGSSDFEVMSEWVDEMKKEDPRRLYALSTARKITPVDDYSATHHIQHVGQTRGLKGPRTDWDFEESYGKMDIPIIAHEIGQWPVYPLWSEIDKYTGVLKARNLKAMYDVAKQNGIDGMDKEFHAASGALNQIMYKYETESFLRTPSCAGVQLLSMQDYQGQGEALVGWLDCFWESKGITTPEAFRTHFDTTVALLRIPKFTWSSSETLSGMLELSHHGSSTLSHPSIWYRVIDNTGMILADENLNLPDIEPGSLAFIDSFEIPLVKITRAMTLTIQAGTGNHQNKWTVWIYPDSLPEIESQDVLIRGSLDPETLELLQNGAKVLLTAHDPGTSEGSFMAHYYPLYWSLTWFPGQGKTCIGLWLDEDHPAFSYFPTAFHSDWQWEAISSDATGFILNDFPGGYRPIAQPVDDFHRNNKTGSIFECRVGEGRLLVCGYDLEDDQNPVSRQLKYSLLKYMNTAGFDPSYSITAELIRKTIPYFPPAQEMKKTESKNLVLHIRAANLLKISVRPAPWESGMDDLVIGSPEIKRVKES